MASWHRNGIWVRCHGASRSPTVGLLQSFGARSGVRSPTQVADREPGIIARLLLFSVVFIAFDDSVTLDPDLGVKLGRLVITPPLLKDLILLSERGQDIAKLADLLANQPRHRFFALRAPPLLIPVQRVECKQ